jgi:hypothetical protein
MSAWGGSLFGAGKNLVFECEVEKGLFHDFKVKGMASCLHAQDRLAVGFYDSPRVAVLDGRGPEECCQLEGHVDGVTQVRWVGP